MVVTARSYNRELDGAADAVFNNGVGAASAGIAASLQAAVNETVEAMIGPADQVCIAGGLALNALLIAHLEQKYDRVFVSY